MPDRPETSIAINFLKPGRLLSLSKSTYRARYPDHLVIFNANILTQSAGKIWWGDLDLTLDRVELQRLADERGEDVFVLCEIDARFKNERNPLLNNAVMRFKPGT